MKTRGLIRFDKINGKNNINYPVIVVGTVKNPQKRQMQTLN